MKLELKQLEIFICILNENCFLVIILNKTFWHKNNLESNNIVLSESSSLNILIVSLNYSYLWKISLRTTHLNLEGENEKNNEVNESIWWRSSTKKTREIFYWRNLISQGHKKKTFPYFSSILFLFSPQFDRHAVSRWSFELG